DRERECPESSHGYFTSTRAFPAWVNREVSPRVARFPDSRINLPRALPSAATFALPVDLPEIVPGYRGGGRAGLTPASLDHARMTRHGKWPPRAPQYSTCAPRVNVYAPRDGAAQALGARADVGAAS